VLSQDVDDALTVMDAEVRGVALGDGVAGDPEDLGRTSGGELVEVPLLDGAGDPRRSAARKATSSMLRRPKG